MPIAHRRTLLAGVALAVAGLWLTAVPAAAEPAAAVPVAAAPATAGTSAAPAAAGVPAAAAGAVPAGGSAVAIAALPHDLSLWGMVAAADTVVKLVMAGLLLASIITWTVLLAKGIELATARRRIAAAQARLAAAGSLDEAATATTGGRGPATALVDAALLERELSQSIGAEGIKERAASRLERIEAAAGRTMSRGTGVLATIGATAPFVGLFGTVWGIMNSFIGISQAQTTNLAVVAPGIAEALLTTAAGLLAAIPAVVIYNAFARSIGGYRAALGDTAAEVMRLLSRDLDRQRRRLRDAAE